MAEACATFPEFSLLRNQKKTFEDFYSLNTMEEASVHLQNWIDKAPPKPPTILMARMESVDKK